jgi:hypothetical protein
LNYFYEEKQSIYLNILYLFQNTKWRKNEET